MVTNSVVRDIVELRQFQESAVKALKKNILRTLNDTMSTIGLKSPTGSGKTIMLADVIKRVIDDKNSDIEVCFIWIAVNKLHLQSKEKLENYYADNQYISCIEWDDIINEEDIPSNNVLFFNWSSINGKESLNRINRDSESQINLEKKIINTVELNRKIILIIDESHHTADSDRSAELIQIIRPNVIVKTSATLDLNEPNLTPIAIRHVDVIEQQMIKRSVKVNYVNDSHGSHTWNNESVIKIALDKRDELLSMYKDEKSNVNPLVLIQIPDKTQNSEDMRESVEDILSNFDINIENRKLAVYLDDSDGKINLNNIEMNDNEVEVLIFKQAIATGWDCPRASILVTFREMKSMEFSIQTLGRIMRMPELKHYQTNYDLNHGYVYTNIEKMNVRFSNDDELEDLGYVDEKIAIKNIEDDICLISEHIERNNERNALDFRFNELFNTCIEKWVTKINLEPSQLTRQIVYDQIENIDEEFDLHTINPDVDDDELVHLYFNKFAESLVGTLAKKRSSEIIMHAIYRFFKTNLQIRDEVSIENLTVVNENNRGIIRRSVELAVNNYVQIARERDAIVRKNHNWNIPQTMEYTRHHTERSFNKCSMNPTYVKENSNYNTELEFMEFLNSHNNVKWWFKNGENREKYFAIVYNDERDDNTYTRKHKFYVDFIVKTNSGIVWLLDTKSGSTLTDESTRFKSDRLIQYINDDDNKIGLVGGIVRQGKTAQEWLYYNRPEYNSDSTSPGWAPLIFD